MGEPPTSYDREEGRQETSQESIGTFSLTSSLSIQGANVKATRDPKAYAERQGKRMTMKKDSKKRKVKSFA